MDPQFETQNGVVDRLKKLYPAVNEERTPLPRAWSPKEKYNLIGLSQNNLRVHYKGKAISRFSAVKRNALLFLLRSMVSLVLLYFPLILHNDCATFIFF